MRWKRLLWGLLAVVVLVLIFAGFKLNKALKAATGKGGFEGLGIMMKTRTDPRQFFPGKDRITVLILGKDYNRDRKGMPYTKGSRSDTMMVMSIDLNHPKITAVSIPRDSKVTAADGVTDKMNSVIVRGGPQLVMETLNSLWGVRPDFYVVLKPDAVRSIVDSLGGVDVEAIDDMNYDDSWGQLHIHLTKGTHHINGADAEGFVRFRKTSSGQRTHSGANLEEGDLRRAARQQQLIHDMVEAAKSPGNLLHIDSIIDTGFKQIETNMTQPQLLALANFFQQEGGGQIDGATLPGQDSTQGGEYFWVLDQNRSTKMMQWLINGDQLAGQSLPRIAVYNSSNLGNAARSIASTLYADGYDAFNAGGKAPLAPVTTVAYRFAVYQPQAQAIATTIGAGPPVKDASNPADTWSPEIKVTVGTDLAQKFSSSPIAEAPNPTSSHSSRRHRKSKSKSKSDSPATAPAPPDVDVQSQSERH